MEKSSGQIYNEIASKNRNDVVKTLVIPLVISIIMFLLGGWVKSSGKATEKQDRLIEKQSEELKAVVKEGGEHIVDIMEQMFETQHKVDEVQDVRIETNKSRIIKNENNIEKIKNN